MLLTPPPDNKLSPTLITEAEALVKGHMASNDPSHDYLHIERVRRMALRIARHFGPEVDETVVELSALFHDMIDHKYVTLEDRSALVAQLNSVMIKNGLSLDRASLVIHIVENTGFSVEKKLRAAGKWSSWHDTCLEYHCVQDADRLDAIGAIGIFRVSCYAACTNEALYDPNDPSKTVHQHFYDKLLYMKDTMRTPLGRSVAERRQSIMEQFIESVEAENELADFA